MTYDIYAAFGNGIRVQLIRCLARQPKNVTELIANCKLSQSAVSQHLLKLRRARLVVAKKTGKEVHYALTKRKTAKIAELLSQLAKEAV